VLLLLTLLVVQLELADFTDFRLFLDLKNSLFNRLGKQYVEDGLAVVIKVEQIVIANLCYFIDACFLGHVLRRGWFGKEYISLCLNVILFRCFTPLLLQEEGQINLNTSWRSRPQVIRLSLRLRLLEF